MISRRWALAGVAAATIVLAGACRSNPEGAATAPVTFPPPITAGPPATTGPAATAAPPASAAPPGNTSRVAPAGAASGPVVAAGAGWTSAGLQGPVPGAGACHYRYASDGYALPDPGCTPGALDPGVTQADLRSTVCRAGGYTSSVRPPERLTEPFKKLAEAAYQDPQPSSRTELDHLVPLGLGGASDTRNLWPEPDQGRPGQFDPQDPYGINAKDGVEDRLHDAVCRGQVGLAAAQQAMAGDWTTALGRLGVTP